MASTRRSVLAALKLTGIAVLYPIFLVVAAIFAAPIVLFQLALANRSMQHNRLHERSIPRRVRFIVIDVVATALSYLLADVLRCALWEGKPWPQHVEGYGSTLRVHLLMLAFLLVAWPTILHWLGWYKARWRSMRWKLLNTVSAVIMLALAMAAFALLAAREVYPRAQIGIVVVLLPLVTGVIRGVIERIGRPRKPDDGESSRLDPVW